MASTEAQLKALAIAPKLTSSISIPCSILIIKEVIADHRRNKGKVRLRALLGMGVIDVLASSGWFLSTWMAPVGSNAVYAVGNTQSCTYQGFLLQIAIGAPMYNTCLALYYLLTIKYGWREEAAQADRAMATCLCPDFCFWNWNNTHSSQYIQSYRCRLLG